MIKKPKTKETNTDDKKRDRFYGDYFLQYQYLKKLMHILFHLLVMMIIIYMMVMIKKSL